MLFRLNRFSRDLFSGLGNDNCIQTLSPFKITQTQLGFRILKISACLNQLFKFCCLDLELEAHLKNEPIYYNETAVQANDCENFKHASECPIDAAFLMKSKHNIQFCSPVLSLPLLSSIQFWRNLKLILVLTTSKMLKLHTPL